MAISDDHELLTTLQDACVAFDISVPDKVSSLCDVLDAISTDLAHSESLRKSIADPSLWPCLRKLWQSLLRAQLTFWDGEDDQDSDDTSQWLRQLCLSLARFTRNLVAGVADNQTKAYENEPDIRRLLHYYTSWTSMENEQAILVARVLAQTLSNIVTANEPLLQSLWETYLNLPEDQVVLIRLLTSADGRTALPGLMLIQNCIDQSSPRSKLLVRSLVGARLCISLLDKMANTYEAEEGTEDANAFDVGYAIFSRLLEAGFVPELYSKLAVADEIITPHQTVLLKLIDSYLQATPLVPCDEMSTKLVDGLCRMLGMCFFSLSSYAQSALRRSLGSPMSQSFPENIETGILPPEELDVMLPKVCEALVLVSQCMVTLVLDAEQNDSDATPKVVAVGPANLPKAMFVDLKTEHHGLDESLVEVLRLLDRFLPRINFGKPVINPSSPPNIQQPSPTNTGFSYLKRDLVRLLGVLCHENKAIQDRTRRCGGIEVVMNLCVVDERNPYLREHAIFTLHNLLRGNPENQAIVDEVQPTTHWDDDGVLRQGGAVRE